jgi:uncharacterized repeat protein (TIGR01451 family)
LNIVTPVAAVIGNTFARFRVCTNNTATDNCSTPNNTVQSGEVEDYQFTVSRKLVLNKITLGGVGGAFGFTLTNTEQTTGSVTTTVANTATQVDGNTANAATLAYSISSASTAVTIDESTLPVGWSLNGASCINAASISVGSLSGSTYTITGGEIAASSSFTCTFSNNKLPILRLQKALPSGRFVASDQFTLNIAGTGGPASVTTTGAGTTATGLATLSPGSIGAIYTLSETAAAGANLGNYVNSYSCTNALAGGQTPSGTGTSFVVTAALGDDLTCTQTNTRNAQADLTISKTNSVSTLASGSTTTYNIVVSNAGPDSADGAILQDAAVAGLSCTGNAVCSASGGAACPGGAINASGINVAVTALQAGVAIPTFPNGGALSIQLSCVVTATGL